MLGIEKESGDFLGILKGSFVGSLLGTAVGDSLGLTYEGLTPDRQSKLFRDIDRQRFLFSHGMVSDDTDHACFVAQALIESRADPNLFERRLARHLRWWLAGIPAGIGLATLRSTMKLCVGVPPNRSGVWSAGNGPAMRSAIIGLYAGDAPNALCELLHRSTRITHTDPKAEIGALAVAVAAQVAAKADTVDADAFRRAFALALDASPLRGGDAASLFSGLFDQAAASAARSQSTLAFAKSLGLDHGVSGYVNHTVPAVLQTWLRHPNDFRAGLLDIIRAGGDTDTTAAILGALIGARVGVEGIPKDWLEGIWEWPRSTSWMRRLAAELASTSGATISYPTWQVPIRNLIFTTAVLGHAFRRALPPY